MSRAMSSTISIQTVDDWWALLDARWGDIVDLAHRFGGFDPSALVPEDVAGCGVVTGTMTNLQAMIHCRESRDQTLARFLFGIWDAAPDRASIHFLPSWHALCDLCSEEWVFNEECAHKE
jgi:hypothetical protein